jgi:hypothetical protein
MQNSENYTWWGEWVWNGRQNLLLYVCPEKLTNPVLDEVESWNLAVLHWDTAQTKGKNSKTGNFVPDGLKLGVENAVLNL